MWIFRHVALAVEVEVAGVEAAVAVALVEEVVVGVVSAVG